MNRDAELDDAVLQAADHLQAGSVPDVTEALIGVGPEGALHHPTIRRPVKKGAIRLELIDTVGRFLGVQLGHAPVVDHLAAAHRVLKMHLPVVFGVDVAQRRGDAALGHDGMGLA